MPKSNSKTTDNEGVNENERAALWFTGLREIAKKFVVQSIYDLSATPYYLTGSGYTAYSLFPWVVSDFGLIEAIESGLVKIPFLPESDNTQELDMPVLRNLYEHVKDKLPKKGQKKKREEANAQGKNLQENAPEIPVKVKLALDQFYKHYENYYQGHKKQFEAKENLLSTPPVFILVCNNTSVSKELYKYIAGYEYEDANGEKRIVAGVKELFSNYDYATARPLRKPPTLLIDSNALEEGDQIDDEFKKIFASEIEEFKKDYARMYGQASTEKITDSEILREVVNTVGKNGKLGAHIRCVVSVSMLTEGWDANTVTHIMGLRAFGSQLLCEQVAGRALRRMSYHLQGYDKDGNATEDKRKIVVEKFPPEYAHIIGVPFKMFKGGKSVTNPVTRDYTHVRALPERQAKYEISFPKIDGYRFVHQTETLDFDFSAVEDYKIFCSQNPLVTVMGSAFLAKEETIEVQSVFEKRDKEIIFLLAKELLKLHFIDEDENPRFHLFHQLLEIVTYWYENKVRLIGERDSKYKKLLFFEEPKNVINRIRSGINPHLNTAEYIRPKLNFYNPEGSTQHVNGFTLKEVYATKKSHVNFVIIDSDWEAKAAKALEEMPEIKSYVKNQFLGFGIPYHKEGKERLYYPDFIAVVESKKGKRFHLIIEITGMKEEKIEKRAFVLNHWLPAANSLKKGEWHFIEITDIEDIKPLLEEYVGRG